MGGEIEASGLRAIRDGEAALFASWEIAERPYPWGAALFPEHTLVYENEHGVLGYAVVAVTVDEAYISNLMVDPKRRRQGIGGLLLQKVIMWAWSRGAKQAMLDVDTANVPAIRLYEKFGFETIQSRKASYPRGEDAFIMRKKL